VKRLAIGWGAFTLLATIALLLARLFEPGRFELELDIFVLAVGGVLLFNVVILIREAYPLEQPVTQLARGLERDDPEVQRLPELERVERELTMANASAFDTHARLRPVVREIVGVRLAARGLRLDASEDVLGPELWELARDDRAAPTDRHAPGVPRESLRRLVERLESL